MHAMKRMDELELWFGLDHFPIEVELAVGAFARPASSGLPFRAVGCSIPVLLCELGVGDRLPQPFWRGFDEDDVDVARTCAFHAALLEPAFQRAHGTDRRLQILVDP